MASMPPTDLDIARAAYLWIQQHGDAATAKAREMVDEMRRKGDADGADTWLRVIVAIGELGAPPTDAWH
jgi:hypothetical protein